jgi:hypothetical protein
LNLKIEEKTITRLAKIGTKLQTWDEIINLVLDHAESCDKFWEDRF